MVLSTFGRNFPKPHLWGDDGGGCAGVAREAREERAGGGRSKKAGSERNYTMLNISQSKKG